MNLPKLKKPTAKTNAQKPSSSAVQRAVQLMSRVSLDSPKTTRIIMVACLVTAGLLIGLKARPAHTENGKAVKELAIARGDLVKQRATLAMLRKESKSKKNKKKRQPSQAKLLAKAVKRAQPSHVVWEREIDRLDRLAHHTGAKLDNIAPGTDPGSKSADMQVSCSFVGCLRFLGGLHGMVTFKGARNVTVVGPLWAVDSLTYTFTGNTMNMTIKASIGGGGGAPTNPAAPATSASPAAPAAGGQAP